MIPKITGAQRDFSAGELDVSMKRADDNPVMKAGARQMSNWRIKNSKTVTNRPGRTALFLANGRIEEIRMSPTATFFIAFGNGTIKVFNSAGAQVFTQGAMPWGPTTWQKVVWDIYQNSIYITFPGNVPQILSWDGAATWTVGNYAEAVSGGQKRTAFYRISAKGITISMSAYTGAVTVTASAAVFVAGMVGTRIRVLNVQILLTGFTSSTVMSGTIQQTSLPLSYVITGTITGYFTQGDIIIAATNGLQAEVFSQTSATTVTVNYLIPGAVYAGTGNFVGPTGTIAPTGAPASTAAPTPTLIWDEEVTNAYRGYAASCFVDQGRLGFCNFASVPGLIVWSAFGVFNDLYTDANNAGPDNAIVEIVPSKSQVLFVMAGAESSEFVFCDNGVYYIPISVTNPLKPGSVAFNLINRDGCAANVQPRPVQAAILWINAGLTSVMAITAPGAYNRPYEARNISELHSHLFNSPVAIAVPSTTSQFEERYAYVLNADGTVAVGKYEIESGQVKGIIGWLPWSGVGTVRWLAALSSDVIFSSAYAPNGIASVAVVEKLDATQYLDAAMSVNAAPAAFAPGGGQGPLWWLAGGTVDLMDQSTRMMGTYTIDGSGNIIPQNNAGENLLAATLVAGQAWTAILEPFVPDAPPGQSMRQRMKKRRVSQMVAYLVNSSGAMLARLFSGPITRTSPALGAIMNTRRIATWNQDDDPTLAPPLREEAQRWRPLGRSFDPRVAVIKDTPGPLEIPEIGIESTI